MFLPPEYMLAGQQIFPIKETLTRKLITQGLNLMGLML
jgi:hypothetical protein